MAYWVRSRGGRNRILNIEIFGTKNFFRNLEKEFLKPKKSGIFEIGISDLDPEKAKLDFELKLWITIIIIL